ncbi:MAG: glycoside hydrolase family 5 protein [Candidatus Saccharimonadaceae bacterium]
MRSLPFIKGVNLGGWLVLEKWMTPSLFSGTEARDEYSLMQTLDGPDIVDQHQKTFIVEEDFVWMAQAGINAVRIPVGYWILDGDGPFRPCIDRLDWAVKQAKKNKLLVMIDLHGAPGSQNGHDHSGRSGRKDWYRSRKKRLQTIDVLFRLAQRYKNNEHVFALQLLNEPKLGFFNFKLRRFYNKAYKRITHDARPGLVTVYHDAFTPRLMARAIRPKRHFPVIMDHHWYQGMTLFSRLQSLKGYYASLVRREKLYVKIQKRQPMIIGEWSLVLPQHLIKNLNHRDEMRALREHERLQRRAFSHTSGWFYWSYKHEKPGIWDFRSQVESGIIEL